MEEIARTLKEARHRLGLTLEEAERSTRIRAHYLEALEQGEIQSIPSQVQARGFLKNYSEYLGLDSGPILQRFSERGVHVGRNGQALFCGRYGLARDDLAEHRLRRAPRVRGLADQHFVEHTGQRVDIRRRSDRLVACRLLG
ncbi:MAG: helix-turn-helix domain-containing protein, partial [Nitrospirae bacterium]|nr:helix-turn-helix domain-containing protein [Nitrospirota bacterium]